MNEIFIRRSIRNFLDKKVEPEKIMQMVKAAMQAPSAMNQQPWEILVIDQEPMLSELKKMKNNTVPLRTAPVLIVLGHRQDLRVANKVEQDLGCAAQNLMLEAVSLGLGTIWIGTLPNEEVMNQVREYTNMPDYITPYAVFGVGYPDKDQNVFVDRFNEDKLHMNKWK